jgi:C-terminal processing protease CtpA/Prc
MINLLYIFLFITLYISNLQAGDNPPAEDTLPADTAEKTPIIPPQNETENIPDYSGLEKDLSDNFSEVLHSALNSNPAAASIIYKKKEIILKDLVKSLQIGAKLVSEDKKQKSDTAQKCTIYSPILIESNKIIYSRLDCLNDQTLNKIHESVCSIMRYARKPDGMILDLRKCKDKNTVNAIKLLSLFKKDEQLFNSKDFRKTKKFLYQITLPLIVITGSETEGSPEIFTDLIKNYSGIVSVGGTTAGSPFPFTGTKMKNGKILKIPVIPEALAEVPPFPVSPDIEIRPVYPVFPYDKFKQGESADKDKAIKRAAEILLCLHALTKKEKVKKNKKK